ncbi:MAG: response regulator [Anaerolineae bacterium]|nr:response regulator [Anaerolineae bacterium]
MKREQPDLTDDRGQGRILIIDDDRDFTLSLVDILESRDYQVEVAHNASGGQEKAGSFDPQVALVDIRLGRESGINLVSRLKETNPDLLCVMMTAYAAMETAVEAIHEGAYDYLQKPLDMRYLLATLDRCFDKLRLESEKAEAETERERLRHLLQNITGSMPSALIALDLVGRVLFWNPAAEALTGQVASQVYGKSLWQTCPELSRYRDLFEQVLNQRQVAHRHREKWTTPSGTVYRDVDVFPLTVNDLEGVVLRLDDVTKRVRLEEMMLQSAKMASVGGLAAGVAHEINNPLGVMMQSAQMLQMIFDIERSRTRERLRAYDVNPAGLSRYLQERNISEYLEGIRTAGERAAKIVSDLLSFSRKSTSQPALYDLNVLVEQTLALAATDYDLKKKYDFRDIEISREFASDLPHVLCDGQQIQQVVLNLVRNAAHEMAKKKERLVHLPNAEEYQPRLMLRTSLVTKEPGHPEIDPDEQVVRLEVEDNGPGVAAEIQPQLFEPFFTTNEEGEGIGLGLWLCWSIVVDRHQGRIWGEPRAEGGARFVVELPVKSVW